MAKIAATSIARAGIIGYGYVGRGTGHALSAVAEIAWHDPALEGSRPLEALANWAQVLFVCVPTPMSASGAADISIVQEVVAQLAVLRVSVPVILRSTVPPQTTEALARRWPDVPLVFCPEFLRERHYLEDAVSPQRVVLGWSASIADTQRAQVRELFMRCFAGVPLIEATCLEAELLKYTSNALFGVKVSFANEMADLTERLGASWETIRAALVMDARVGDGHLAVPGPDGERGFGGKCLPKDMAALLSIAEENGTALDVVAAAVAANQRRRRTP